MKYEFSTSAISVLEVSQQQGISVLFTEAVLQILSSKKQRACSAEKDEPIQFRIARSLVVSLFANLKRLAASSYTYS